VWTLTDQRPWLPFGSSSLWTKMVVVMASAKKHFRFSDKSEMKIYSDLPGGKSCGGHVSYTTIACEAGCVLLTCPGALDSYLELRGPCMTT
jgi:hypothetical protein